MFSIVLFSFQVTRIHPAVTQCHALPLINLSQVTMGGLGRRTRYWNAIAVKEFGVEINVKVTWVSASIMVSKLYDQVRIRDPLNALSQESKIEVAVYGDGRQHGRIFLFVPEFGFHMIHNPPTRLFFSLVQGTQISPRR